MRSSRRVFINTLALYIRTIINMVVSLYVVRIVLISLGEEDFGIFTLIGGVVAMLSFLTNALVQTTQRFVSFYQGKGEITTLKNVFNTSVCLHIAIGGLTIIILESLLPFIFSGLLQIPNFRLNAAKIIYHCVVISLFFTFSTSPFKALVISHENILYSSLIDVLDSVLKLGLVFLFPFVPIDKLVYYGLITVIVQVFQFFALSVYCYTKYQETTIPNFTKLSIKLIKEILGFASWTVYSSGCVLGRQQGVAIILNRAIGPAINSAYGIGFQVAGYTNFLAQSLVTAITPQIVKSESSGDRERALWLSAVISKFMFFLVATLCVPCMFEIDYVLEIWLNDVPEYTPLFCIMVILTLLVDAISQGLTFVNQAIGNIKAYSLILYTPKLLTLPLFYLCLKLGYGLQAGAIIYIMVELLCSLIRIPFTRRSAGLKPREFYSNVVYKEFIPFLLSVLCCAAITTFIPSSFVRVVITSLSSLTIFIVAIWTLGLDKIEKALIVDILCSIKAKLHYLKI